ncbi:hypothetical protein L6164_018037 [Bauhinia variegata]|uniref:Uncharacterized protein n=1 Tax=Bauhinia variegata TaxID=167791 RepID=A0ACB9NBX1_BAUVA|nr:hypothetical protein L6164_018037 [Bauhinia variegata]
MELGLSLGESPKPLEFMEKPREASNHLGLGFNTTLSIGPISREKEQPDEEKVEKKENKSHEHHSLSPKSGNNPVQLDLLPHTPVVTARNPLSQLSFPWPPLSENGSSAEVGSSRGLEVNRLPSAPVPETEEGAAVSSSPNSAASSFQMDLCIYSRGGSFSGSGNYNGKRDHSDDEAYDQRASSRASDEDDNGGSTRKKLRLSKEQSAFLEESFKEHNTLNPKQKLALAKQLNLRPRQVEVWFQNRRARTKLKQTEVDCEYLKRCCETLTEENRKLHKELQELRALKTSNPFYMQLPATTLTMCPSCERVATNSTTTSSATPPTISTNTGGAMTMATTTTAKTIDPTSKSIGLPFRKPRFYPFAHTQPHLHPSTAS